ncbi:hypothetical protein ATZ36_11695 [Candidatus Endomicrobiellum trichonymphae]|uniref:Uncharacterized protein n=1 Tax=Endomicrobium trichonymphae TaxID=1408204 RepID=A0A1E5IEY9_ENDTX|nr:hypothetical protein ATZ36_11695 [Candidatus Endomicrobium trichonymphae]
MCVGGLAFTTAASSYFNLFLLAANLQNLCSYFNNFEFSRVSYILKSEELNLFVQFLLRKQK